MSDLHKYQRTAHLPFSKGLQNDDRVHPDISYFEGKRVIVTEKMDGEGTSIYTNHIHARSLDTPYHPSRTVVNKLQGEIGYLIPDGWRICGENVYAEHSIFYKELESHFYVFSIWNQNNECLSYDETVEWCFLLGLTHAPVLYDGIYDENVLQELVNHPRLQIREYVEGIGDPMEGFVVRIADSFHYEEVDENRLMLNLAKYVRKDHVQTDEHWLEKPVTPNKLKGQ